MPEPTLTLRELRARYGAMTQAEFGKTIGVSAQTVSAWEKNIYSIKPIHLMAICKKYNVTSQELLGR